VSLLLEVDRDGAVQLVVTVPVTEGDDVELWFGGQFELRSLPLWSG
jgi:hypothetical protein